MVFGELLGGMLEGAGEHYRQRELRRHALENWQRENDLQLTSNFLTQNYGNLSPDQIGNLTGRIEKLTGMKTGALGAMIPVAQAIHQFIPPQPSSPNLGQPRSGNFDTPLSPTEEAQFQQWKARYAPRDSGEDYDLRGAYKAGLQPDPVTGHWPDTFKKPNHPTFSNESQYAGAAPGLAGSWQGPNRDVYTAAPAPPATTIASPNFTTPIQTRQFGAIAPANKFAGQQISEPQQIQIGQIPTPAETATPSIFAPQPGYMAKSEPRLQMTPNQILARQKTEQDQADLQQKVANIMNSTLSDTDKAEAIKALYIPAGILVAQNRAVSGPSAIGLGVQWIESPDGKQRMGVQATRGGGYLDASTGKPIDPKSIAGWTKVYDQPVQLVPNNQGTMDVVNKGKLGKSMRTEGTITGTLPDIHPAETHVPLEGLEGEVAVMKGTRTGHEIPVSPNLYRQGATPISSEASKTLGSINTVLDRIQEAKPLLGQVAQGPLWGRIAKLKLRYLGGVGSSPEEQELNRLFNVIMYTAVRPDVGANFTGIEQEIVRTYTPNLDQTVEQALGNLNLMERHLQGRSAELQTTLTPRQQKNYEASQQRLKGNKNKTNQNPPPTSGGGGAAGQRREQRRPLPNGGYEYQHSLDGGKTWQPGRLQ